MSGYRTGPLCPVVGIPYPLVFVWGAVPIGLRPEHLGLDEWFALSRS
jgi:hypothetical protein